MSKLEELGFPELLTLARGFAKAGLLGELSERTLYRLFITGARLDNPPDETNAVLDAAASLLIIEHGRRDILTTVAALIFSRNRRGLYIHDLIWSFFHDVSSEALAAVAEYLVSDDPRDARLACKLLHLRENPDTPDKRRETREKYLAWLSENRPFLYLTGEHLNYSNEPEALACDIEARYLHREISPKDRAPIEPLTEEERGALAVFRALPCEEQSLLADHSARLHRGDIHVWREWMGMDAAAQVIAARSESEAV